MLTEPGKAEEDKSKSLPVVRNSRSRIFVTVGNLCALLDGVQQWTTCCLTYSSHTPGSNTWYYMYYMEENYKSATRKRT